MDLQVETNEKNHSSLRIPNIYLPLLLSFILIDEVSNNYIYNVFSTYSGIKVFLLYSSFLLVQIIGSPIQAGYSDFYCRKKSLIISLSSSFLSIILTVLSIINSYFALPLLALVILTKGGLGNNLPLSWAGIADTQTRNFRFSLGLSTAAMALGYFILVLISDFFNGMQAAFIMSIIFIILIYSCIKKFKDIRDMQTKDIFNERSIRISFLGAIVMEIKLLINNFLKIRRTRKALLAFMLWEISFYTALIVDADLQIKDFKNLSISILIGYLFGVLILKFSSRKSDHEMIKIGYILSIISLIPIFLLSPFITTKILMMPCYFVYSLAAAFLAPSLFSILSKERAIHEQGKIYGLIDSTDTVAFLIATLSVMLYNFLKVEPIYLFSFSLLMFIVSWVPYAEFKKTKSEASR